MLINELIRTEQIELHFYLEKGRHVYLICRDPANPTKKFFMPESEVLD